MPLVVPDQTAAIAAAIAAGTMLSAPPPLSDSVPGVPTKGLFELFRPGLGLTIVDGKVASWRGFNDTLAQQPDVSKRPVSSGGVAFTGTGDYLATPLIPDATSGYLVAKVKRALGGSGAQAAVIAGEQQTGSSPLQRLALGFSSSDQVTAFIGDSTPVNFSGSSTIAGGSTVVIGLRWDNGVGVLRVNSAQERLRTFNSGGAGVGARPLWLGASNAFSGLAYDSADTLIALMLYSGSLTDAECDARDAAIAAF